jgi:uncharacterized protein
MGGLSGEERPGSFGWLEAAVRDWTAEIFLGWSPPARPEPKVVRDPLHDFIRLEAHEVAVWDTPLVQRLRYIHQTALGYLVYPGLHHSRFEHSIGVMYVANAMLTALAGTYEISALDRLHVRLAALLHDVGHVPFSHLGETALTDAFPGLEQEVWTATYQGTPRFFDGVHLGEVLSYLMVVSPTFESAFRDVIAPAVGDVFGTRLSEVDLHRVGRLIIGKTTAGEPSWPAQIINGSFDADKLDYIMRDSQASGIQTEVDTSRLIHSLRILGPDYDRALAVTGNAVTYLEQILLAKMTLYVALYHHHKIRAIECMALSFFEDLPAGGPFPKPADIGAWLRMTEPQVFAVGGELPPPTEQFNDILNRRLLQRCLVLDRNTVEPGSRTKFESAAMLLRNRVERIEFRDRLAASLPNDRPWNAASLWIDLPRPPDVDQEAAQCLVELAPDVVANLSELMPADDWVRSYVANKLRGHIFYAPVLADRAVVASRAEELLAEEPYRVRLKPLARRLALKN